MKIKNIIVIAMVLLSLDAMADVVMAIKSRPIVPANVVPMSAPISASGVWMNVQYPTNYLSYYTVNSEYREYIPVTVTVYNNSMNLYKNIKVVFYAVGCDGSGNCKTYTQIRYTNTQGQAVFIEVFPYEVSSIYLNIDAYNNAGAIVADFWQDLGTLGD